MSDKPNQKRARGRPRSADPDGGGTTVQALDRAVLILQCLAARGRATLSELAEAVEMPPSTAHRLLLTLQAHRMVAFQDATQDWLIGVEAFRIGSAFAQRSDLVDIAREAMHALVDATGETANLAIADAGEVVFMSQVDTSNPIRAFFRTGTRAAMHSSGIGKALLAEMAPDAVAEIAGRRGLTEFTAKTLTSLATLKADLVTIRDRGWSLDDEERHLGMRCIAAPVFNAHGEAVAGLSISGPAMRVNDAALPELARAVCRAAADVTERTGGVAPRR
ncbi:MAG: HTH-type transcriptional regulator BhcR [Pseudomonadota bacterium]